MPDLIGRTRELAQLEDALHAASGGSGGCILLTGEAGIGKSRLVAELRRRALTERFGVLEGHCFEEDASFPYAPWIDALRAFLASKSTAETAELMGTFSSEAVKLLPELALLLPSLKPTPALDPPAEKRRLFESLARLVASLAASNPLLVILEDLHWSDEQSLEFLDYFVRRIPANPILVLGTYRSEESSPRLAHHLAELSRQHLVEEIPLRPLDRAQVGQLAQSVMKSRGPMSSDWLDLLMPLTEGNPFLVEEMAKSVPDAAAGPGTLENLQIPRSFRDSVQRRVDGLSESSRRILSSAAVIGERFDFGLLQAVTARAERELLRVLKEMIAAGLIVEESADQCAFRHALTRQAVYALLMQRERKAMHQAIGATLERSAGTRTEAAADRRLPDRCGRQPQLGSGRLGPPHAGRTRPGASGQHPFPC